MAAFSVENLWIGAPACESWVMDILISQARFDLAYLECRTSAACGERH